MRVVRGGAKGFRTGLATTTDLAAADFRGLFAQAWELSALGDEDPWLRQADPSGSDDLPSRFDASVEAITPQQRIARALDLEAQARRASKQVAAVREAAWSDGTGASLLLTQKGVRTPDVYSSCSAALDLAVADGAERQAAWHWDASRHPDLDLAAIGAEAALTRTGLAISAATRSCQSRTLRKERISAGSAAIIEAACRSRAS